MWPGVSTYNFASALLFAAASWPPSCAAVPSTSFLSRRSLALDFSPAPPPEEGPELSAGALRDPAYLPAQIGGIVGAYAFSLVLVALLLLALAKRRREHLRNRDLPEEENTLLSFNPFPQPFLLQSEEEYKKQLEQFQTRTLTVQTDLPRSPIKNFSLPAGSPLSPTRTGPLSPAKSQHSILTAHSFTSTILAAGVDLSVDQTVVQRDRAMAQQQLEEMYKYVMEQEQAKAEGREYQGPPLTSPSAKSVASSKRERNKPSNLNLNARDEKSQSRSSSLFSFLKSPRKKSTGTMNISSPIMTPMSGTFPRHDDQEMNAIPHRHYAPAAPPPVPSDLAHRSAAHGASSSARNNLPTPEISPASTQSIDSRIDAAIGQPPSREDRAAARREQRGRDDNGASHSRDVSAGTSTSGEHEPVSAVSDKSTSGLVGLPTSPKPGVNRFPSLDSLPASPRPGQQTFATQPFGGQSSAVRQGGALPLRAYEPSLASPTAESYATTKQTVFTRAAGPLSPGMQTGLMTPWTGAPVPYTPYQPFSPVVPITPSVVTRADRKRMKKLEPKTPTVEMVKDTDEVW
ncbi:hypothetical protein MFIFM68171_06109 [Madurella fahalii]|uniref:Uncharacterized protein n=1 Tax=Madurella fahalii TaxID=1157608 RepID=A0ABQ0GDY9_9PEZI